MKTKNLKKILLGIGIIIGVTATLIASKSRRNTTAEYIKKEQQKETKNVEKYSYSFHLFQW